MESTVTHGVTDLKIIEDFTEATTDYREACERTLEQDKVIRHVRKQTAEFALNLPKHNNVLENWSVRDAEELACQMDLVSSAYSEQAIRFHAQVRTIRRLNACVRTIKDEVRRHEDI